MKQLPLFLFASSCLLFASSPDSGLKSLGTPLEEKSVPQVELRGFGKVEAKGSLWETSSGEIALVRFQSGTPQQASILAAKYAADLKAYGAVSEGKLPTGFGGAAYEIRHGGLWIIGRQEDSVFVLSGANAAVLAPLAKDLKASAWIAPEPNAYPRYLDCFDNAALGIWWMPTMKPPEILDFFRENIGIVNNHPKQELEASYAPNVFDHAAHDNVIAQARLIGKPYRLMTWGGIPAWWSWNNDRRETTEVAPEASLYRNLAKAAGSKNTQIVSPTADAVHMAAMLETMNRYKDDPDLIAWMEPHGEFFLYEPRLVPPGAQARCVNYHQTVKKLSLEKANAQFGLSEKSWEEFQFPEMAYFFGREGRYLDLDSSPWRWKSGPTMEEGEAKGFEKPDFDDSAWALDKRNSYRLQNEFGAIGNTNPLWYRFHADIPADTFSDGARIFLHVMPATEYEGGMAAVWVNGQPAPDLDKDRKKTWLTRHLRFDVTDLLKSGENSFAIYSHGGRIAYRVFLSEKEGEDFPFKDLDHTRYWLAWNDYLIWEKLQTLERWLQFMRTVDPVRPIKVMTPHIFQAEGLDLLERYGAYPQLTGEGGWYRPMHYKGYARLRRLPASSEGGGPMKTDRAMQRMFSFIFWANQDCHDYVFDAERDFWSKPSVVEWWRNNGPLLRTLGKIDFGPITVGMLRDVEQDKKYLTGEIWNWDVSRGLLPAAGVSPVLVDGPEFDRGMAAKIPVVFDCATTVMTPERVQAILKYVEDGGTFIALHNTGRHSIEARNSWPLASALGLHIEDHLTNAQNFNNWPTARIAFTPDQKVMPSLRGKTAEGSGISIDYKGNNEVGAVKITSDAANVSPVATWEDGSMAVCEVALGKGRLIWMGTPFYLRFKDDSGKFINAEDRQKLFKELVVALDIPLPAASSDPRVWVEKRESKNGLYDIFIAGALGVRGDDWKLSDEIPTTLTLRNTDGRAIVDATAAGAPDVPSVSFEDGVKLENQIFHPFQIRQFAVLRPRVGLEGPLRWLQTQKNYWRAITIPAADSVPDVKAVMQEEAVKFGEDGIDLSENWKIRKFTTAPAEDDSWTAPSFDVADWEQGKLGTWLVNGWPDAVQVQYRRQVTIPPAWLADGRRVLLGFKSGWRQLGIKDSARLWIDGKPLPATIQNPLLIDITDSAKRGELDLALEVAGSPMSGGPCGVLYLHSVAAPVATLSLDGEWTTVSKWDTVSGTVNIPGRVEKVFGIRKTFELPADWNGAKVRLILDQGDNGNIDGVIINGEGYFNCSSDILMPYGPRIDHWLKPGTNTIDFYPRGHVSYREQSKARIKAVINSIRLEKYDSGRK